MFFESKQNLRFQIILKTLTKLFDLFYLSFTCVLLFQLALKHELIIAGSHNFLRKAYDFDWLVITLISKCFSFG
jgi:hypothetical protein